MQYGSGKIHKDRVCRFWRLQSAYLAHLQRDAAGLIVFDEVVRHFVQPSMRQGQLHRLLHGIDQAEPAASARTDSNRSHTARFSDAAQVVALISDFWEQPKTIVDTVSPLRFRGNELVLFHV